jgi:uncharacterized protein YndB with AHSA1/START domain
VETTTERLSVTREVVIDASPETVWEFLTDPEKITRWKGLNTSFEGRVGAGYRTEVIPDNIAVGEVLELDPPHRLAYSWGWEGSDLVPPGSTVVEYELLPEGDATRVRLTHRDLPSPESLEQHVHGWEHYLGRLSVAATGGDPGPDQFATERS